jgi:hypothetical protein
MTLLFEFPGNIRVFEFNDTNILISVPEMWNVRQSDFMKGHGKYARHFQVGGVKIGGWLVPKRDIGQSLNYVRESCSIPVETTVWEAIDAFKAVTTRSHGVQRRESGSGEDVVFIGEATAVDEQVSRFLERYNPVAYSSGKTFEAKFDGKKVVKVTRTGSCD